MDLSETANRRSLDGIVLHAATGTPGIRPRNRLSADSGHRQHVCRRTGAGWENDPPRSRRMENVKVSDPAGNERGA